MSGEVPEGWRSARLGDVAVLGGGTTPSRSEPAYWEQGTIPWATPSDITSLASGSSRISDTEDKVSERALAECSLTLNPPGTVLMTSRASIGFVVINEVPMATNQGFINFRVGESLDADYLLYWLTAQRDQLVAAAGGSTFKELSRGTAKLLPILVPPLDEQRLIAEVLRSVDEAIAATKNTVQAATIVRQVALDAMIQRVLGDLETKARPLSDVAEVRTGLAKNKNRTGPKVMMPYLRVANVQDGWFDLTDMQEIEVDPAQVDRYLLQPGDVLLTEGGDYDKLGRGGVWKGEVAPCLHQNHVFCVRPNISALMPEYFALATQSAWGRAYFLSCAKRTTNLASINSSQLKGFPVPVVSVKKQAELIEEIEGIDAMIALEEQQLETLLRLRVEVSFDLLSGRVRVPTPAINTAKVVPPAFKRAVFAAEIVHQLHNDNRFGSVKHEKIVHVCELHLGLQADLDRHAYKEAAGPYDPKARRSVERIFQQQKWFDATKTDGKRVIYVPLEKAGGHKDYFDRYFGDQKAAIQSIIDLLRPLNTEQCEIVATLYAVWNDFLIDKQQPGDDEIVASVHQWHPNKQEIAGDRWLAALPWMRQKGLVPKGIGEKTRVVRG